jgi:type IV secretory pathway VirB10-like protein
VIERAQPIRRPACHGVRARRLPVLTLLLMFGAAGCRHKNMPLALPQIAHAPVDLEVPAPAQPPIIVAELPPPTLGPPSIAPPLPAPPKRRPTPPKEETQPPVQVAEAAPAELAIGTLSTGGDLTPKSQQEAQDMIAPIVKRATVFSARTEQQKRQIRQVRYFLKQAQQALNSGDPEGAMNLATKARLLMDDLEKK